jgi:hypothetical protein
VTPASACAAFASASAVPAEICLGDAEELLMRAYIRGP